MKYLGVLIDQNLNWKVHIDLIALKVSKAIGMIAKLRHFVPLSVLVKFYQSKRLDQSLFPPTSCMELVRGVKLLSLTAVETV